MIKKFISIIFLNNYLKINKFKSIKYQIYLFINLIPIKFQILMKESPPAETKIFYY
jgi:hypothetical protein